MGQRSRVLPAIESQVALHAERITRVTVHQIGDGHELMGRQVILRAHAYRVRGDLTIQLSPALSM